MKTNTPNKIIARKFLEKVKKTKTCWNWIGLREKKGYGLFCISWGHNVLAHRMSYILNVAPIPNGMCVLHHCDNPGCVNPSHLWIGTNADNVRDRDEKGRGAVGTKHGRAVIKDSDVREIRRLRENLGIGNVSIARMLNLSPGPVHYVIYNDGWKHIK